MAGVIRAVIGTDILGSSVNSLMHGDLAGAGGLFRMGSKVVLGEVFGQWSWQTFLPTDAAAAGFSTRAIGKGGMGLSVGHQPGHALSQPVAARQDGQELRVPHSMSPQTKTWGLGMFPGRVAGAWVLSAGVARDGMPAISAAGFLGAMHCRNRHATSAH